MNQYLYESCPCLEKGKDGTYNHGVDNIAKVKVGSSGGVFPVCSNHIENYEVGLKYNLYTIILG
jgi:hypothetical protein